MCGRYTNANTREQLAETFPEVANLEGTSGFERFNIAPTQQVVALVTDDDRRQATRLRWGLIPHWARDPKIGYRMLNARSETLTEKPAFRSLVRSSSSRCLIPATGYFEWLKPESPKAPKQPMHFTLADGEPFAFAGLWTTWRNPEADGEELQTCTILTTNANAIAAPVHHRMPVILADDAARVAWLDASLDAEGVTPLLAPLAHELLRVAPANPLVNAVRNEGAHLLDAPDVAQPMLV